MGSQVALQVALKPSAHWCTLHAHMSLLTIMTYNYDLHLFLICGEKLKYSVICVVKLSMIWSPLTKNACKSKLSRVRCKRAEFTSVRQAVPESRSNDLLTGYCTLLKPWLLLEEGRDAQ